jgi:N-acetylglucosamine kinase-like BadF-type ATPase
MSLILIADSGSSKTEWCLIDGAKKKTITTQGLSPYFLSGAQITEVLTNDLFPKLKNSLPDEIYFYGTGCSNSNNVKIVRNAISSVFKGAKISVDHDLMGAAKALCGNEKGIACILGSGAYLGRKVIQYYLYHTFDADLMDRFDAAFHTNSDEILENVYKKPLPNKYLANFAMFLAENRGHFMIENIIEDGFNDFFFNHIYKYRESWTMPINFAGSIAYGFKDVLKDLCNSYELQLGKVIKRPMDGLIKFHQQK